MPTRWLGSATLRQLPVFFSSFAVRALTATLHTSLACLSPWGGRQKAIRPAERGEPHPKDRNQGEGPEARAKVAGGRGGPKRQCRPPQERLTKTAAADCPIGCAAPGRAKWQGLPGGPKKSVGSRAPGARHQAASYLEGGCIRPVCRAEPDPCG